MSPPNNPEAYQDTPTRPQGASKMLPRSPQDDLKNLSDAPESPPKRSQRNIPRDPHIHPRGSWHPAQARWRVGPKAII